VKYQTLDIGALYRLSADQRVGLMVKNIVDIHESSRTSFKKPENAGFSLPVYVTLGFSTKYKCLLLSLDNELIQGHYGGAGSKKATFWFVRAGLERPLNHILTFRCGLTIPIIARTDTLGNIRNDLPWPKMGGSIGVSANFNRFILDFAVFGDPAQSYVEQEIRIRAAGSIILTL
jgi:hypothetical protein